MEFNDYEKIVDILINAGTDDPIRDALAQLAEAFPVQEEQWNDKYNAVDCHPE